MILQYTDVFTGQCHKIKATTTTDHPASHYGLPVIVLPDGDALDANSWILNNYCIVRANRAEIDQTQQAMAPYVSEVRVLEIID